MWRPARPEDGDEIVSMCLALYREDPGFAPVEADPVREPWVRASVGPMSVPPGALMALKRRDRPLGVE
jgi:hypothetical protein